MSQERQNKIYLFVVNNKTNCYRAFKTGIKHKDYKTDEGKKLVELARKDIGYSSKTWGGDIYHTLWEVYFKLINE
jgi:hypothetical protein